MGDDKRRLFRVSLEVELTALVLATSAKEAEAIAKDAFDEMDGHDDPSSSAVEFPDDGKISLPEGWDNNCLVYHSKNVDVDVSEAMEIHRSNRKSKSQIDMFMKDEE